MPEYICKFIVEHLNNSIIVGIFYRSRTTLIMTFFLDIIIGALMCLRTKLRTILVMYSSGKNEFEANYINHKLGYGLPLSEILDLIAIRNNS